MTRKTRTAQQSFAAGIIAPELYARLDQAKYQIGLATCTNFMVLPHGPIANRPGLEFIKEAADSSAAVRLIEFIFNTEQAYVLEFGDAYMRVHTEGATVLESAQNVTAATSASPVKLTVGTHGYATGDEVYLAGLPGDFAALNGRYFSITVVDASNFTLDGVDGSAFAAYTAGGTAARVYTLATPYAAADLFALQFVQSADVLTLVHPSYAPRELSRVSATNWNLAAITFAPSVAPPTGVTATATVGTGSITYDYVVTSIAADGLEESVASSSSSITNNLDTLGNYNTVTFTNASGAVRYNVYRARSGVYGYVGQCADGTSGFIDDNITPDMLTVPPENPTLFNSADNYPSTVTYFEQRRVFGATNNAPQNTWMTRSGTASNMTKSIPSRDDDAITFGLSSRQLNRVRHLVPLTDLLMLTSAGEWKVTAQNSDAITPTTIWVRQQGYTGASTVAPVVAQNAVLYLQAQGGHLRDMAYSFDSNVYKSRDISVLAPHLFDGYTFTDAALTQAPYPILWLVRSDGKLLGLTYLPDQDVLAYHLHETDGAFESVAAIPESNADILYAMINRTIGGSTKRYVERLHTRRFSTVEDAFFVDSGLTYDGAATDTITGLWHLEGETVAILTDGSVHPRRTVSGGQITLDYEASVVHIGLPYTAAAKTLPLTLPLEAYGQGTDKKVQTIYLRVDSSRGVFAGPDTDHLVEYKERTTEAYGDPTQPISDELEITLDSYWQRVGQVLVQQSDPLPITILSIAADVLHQ